MLGINVLGSLIEFVTDAMPNHKETIKRSVLHVGNVYIVGNNSKGDEDMTIEEAIKCAVENGFTHYEGSNNLWQTLCDRTFWIALGKGMGWRVIHVNDHIGQKGCSSLCYKEYLMYWHRFIDCLDSGITIEQFFEGIEKEKV